MMRIFIRYVVPVLAGALFVIAVLHVVRTNRETPAKQTRVAEPPVGEFKHHVAAAGLVEARSENIAVASPVPGIVEKLEVKVGQRVAAGEPLFRLRSRQLRAELAIRKSAVTQAEADLARLRSLPRVEEVPVKEAAVREAAASMEETQGTLSRTRAAYKKNAVTLEVLEVARGDFATSKAKYEKSVAELKLLKAGSSKEELAVAQAAVRKARSGVSATETEIARRTITALVAGEVLQLNIRPGEFVGTPPSQTVVLLGNTRQLHVRVDIDEHDIPRFRPGAKAVAMLKGAPHHKYPLEFVRVEPYVIPKRSLTGENTERIDTRVLQAIYRVDMDHPGLFVGQQMDVYIRAGAPDETPR